MVRGSLERLARCEGTAFIGREVLPHTRAFHEQYLSTNVAEAMLVAHLGVFFSRVLAVATVVHINY